jgi:hypothetical protein
MTDRFTLRGPTIACSQKPEQNKPWDRMNKGH